jgi:GPH family glycoside/pentoside/hexuronide:cation symporter
MTITKDNSQPPTFGLKKKIYWGSASLGGATIQGVYMSFQSIFFNDYLGLTVVPSLILIIMLIYTVVNALNDPIFGFISDRTRSENGRRIPYMKYTIPLFTVSFILIWFSPGIETGIIPVFLWLLITICLYDTSYTIIFMVYSALLPEITESEKERNKLNVWAMFFYLIGQIIGFIVPDIFRRQSKELLWISMITMGIIGGLLILVTTLKFKERPELTQVKEPLPPIAAFKYTIVNKSFITLVSANFMGIFLQSMVVGSIYYLADYVLKIENSIIPLIFLFIPLLVSIWLTPKMTEKFGVVRSDQILLIIGGVALILLTFMPFDLLIYLCLAIAGIGFVGPLVFTNILFAQVCDEDELKTGRRREAAYFGVNAMITKPAQSLVVVIPGIMLALSNFKPRTGPNPILDQPFMVFVSIRIFIGLIPGIALLLGALILQFYPLKGEYWEEVQEEVLELHQEKQKKYQDMQRKTGAES